MRLVRTNPARLIAPVALGLALLALLRPTLAHAVDVWSTTEEFSYGFLILPVAGALVWWRRAAIRAAIGRGSAWGLAITLGALMVYVAAWRMGIHALAGLAVSPLLWGVVVYLWGWGAARELAFPIGFLAFGLCVFRGLLDSVGFALQQVTAVGAADVVASLGVPVVRDGLSLTSRHFNFVVAEGCSGMSSLVSLAALAALWTYAAKGSGPARLAVLASVVPLVILANSLRVALVLLVADAFGQDAALGYFHGLSSLVLFGVALAGLIAISRTVRCRPFGLAA
jgi:exosortase